MTRRLLSAGTTATLAFALLATTAASGQRIELPAGTRVRLWIPARTIGTIVAADGVTWTFVLTGSADTIRVSHDSVRAIEVNHPRRQWLIGAGIGAIAGSAVALGIAAATCDPDNSGNDFGCFFRIIFSPFIGAGVGGVVGAGVGGLIKTENWVPLDRDAVRVSVEGRRGARDPGVRLSVSLPF